MNKLHIYYDCIHTSEGTTTRTWSYDYALPEGNTTGCMITGFTGQKFPKFIKKVGCEIKIEYNGEIVAQFPKGSAGKDINNFIDSYFGNELRKAKLELL